MVSLGIRTLYGPFRYSASAFSSASFFCGVSIIPPSSGNPIPTCSDFLQDKLGMPIISFPAPVSGMTKGFRAIVPATSATIVGIETYHHSLQVKGSIVVMKTPHIARAIAKAIITLSTSARIVDFTDYPPYPRSWDAPLFNQTHLLRIPLDLARSFDFFFCKRNPNFRYSFSISQRHLDTERD